MVAFLKQYWDVWLFWLVVSPVYYTLGYYKGRGRLMGIFWNKYTEQMVSRTNSPKLTLEEGYRQLGYLKAVSDILDEIDKPENRAWPIRAVAKVGSIIKKSYGTIWN